ncbi:MAG: ATP-binding protein [Clostridiales bacterium]|nr:ATP-binding protein [Clostridiales bacterium]
MPYEPQVLRAANQRLAQRREKNAQDCARRRQQVYAQLPRVQTIDQQLRQTVALAATTALRTGEDPTKAIAAIRDKNLALQQERKNLLQSNGYSPDCLEEKPVCPVCKDTGWVGAQMCGCLKALCTEEQNKLLSSLLDLQGQTFQRFQLDYYGPSYSQDRVQMQAVYNTCRRYAVGFGSFPIKNLLMTGTPGVGKTYLSACIAGTVSSSGFSVVYDTAIHVFAQFEAEHFTREPEAQKSAKRYLNCDLLILDDLGSEMTTPFVQSALYNLVNSRLISSRATVISTNLTLEEISGRYSMQAASRLRGEYQLLQFQGPDIRQLKNR